ncbi:hypothetical protein E2A64_07025 [Pseudohoeflea suaedae]|uniref:Uncharacterized protein n=1 Tax=Pseudohoeflea suaedae TaxID=877384 RepID=A0A4R5PPB3_9HYPH|nr:hypothetical protein [Pseudohoeflea suaedae]TDH38839.1 hypothetical protein E2A64_07025 [Pseudohoeflea suaedae]
MGEPMREADDFRGGPGIRPEDKMAPVARILEIKQALDSRVEAGAGRADPSGTAKMLAQMRGVLSRELDRFAYAASGPDGVGVDGKAAVDLVSLIARTLEKVDQLERQMAEVDAERQQMTPGDRLALRQTVADLIDTLAERKVARMRDEGDGHASLPPCGVDVTKGDRGG